VAEAGSAPDQGGDNVPEKQMREHRDDPNALNTAEVKL
jgi:hypothetical protein